jgi:hypothetical protein
MKVLVVIGAIAVLPPRFWLQRTNVWRRVTSPARGAKRLRRGTAIARVSTGH